MTFSNRVLSEGRHSNIYGGGHIGFKKKHTGNQYCFNNSNSHNVRLDKMFPVVNFRRETDCEQEDMGNINKRSKN